MAPWDAYRTAWAGWNDFQRVSATTVMVFMPLYIASSWGFKPAFLMACIIGLGMLVLQFGDGTPAKLGSVANNKIVEIIRK